MKHLELFPFPKDRIGEMEASLAESLFQWAESEVVSKRLEFREDYDALVYPALKKLVVDIGLQSMVIPEKSGGEGHSSPDVAPLLAVALEQVGRADTGIGYVFSCTFALQSTFAVEPNVNQELCDELGPYFCESDEPILCSLILPTYGDSSSGGGSDFQGKSLQVGATQRDGEWVLEGKSVRPIDCGANGKLYGALCSIDGSSGNGGPAMVLFKDDAEGLSRGEVLKETGLAASRNAELELKDIRVPGVYRSFNGVEAYRGMLSWLYLCLSATAVGGMFRAYEILKEWGDTRVIKGTGHIFKENPLTASLMAEVAKNISVSRMLTHNLAATLAHPDVYGKAGGDYAFVSATMVVHRVLSLAEKVTNNAMELMASAGYAKEWNLERYWRDLKTMQLVPGADVLANMDVARYFYQCQTL